MHHEQTRLVMQHVTVNCSWHNTIFCKRFYYRIYFISQQNKIARYCCTISIHLKIDCCSHTHCSRHFHSALHCLFISRKCVLKQHAILFTCSAKYCSYFTPINILCLCLCGRRSEWCCCNFENRFYFLR